MTVSDVPAGSPNTPSPLERWSLRLSRVGLLVIVAVTFVTSFAAVSVVAAERGAVDPHLAWALPLAIDGMIVVGSAVAWVESLKGARWHPFPVILVAAAGALSVAANVAHAAGGDWLARLLAAVPPAFLLAAVELGAWQIRRDVQRRTQATQPTHARVQAAQPAAQSGATPTQPGVHIEPGDYHAAARAWLARNPGRSIHDATRADIADLAQRSVSAVSRQWDTITAAVNGHHP